MHDKRFCNKNGEPYFVEAAREMGISVREYISGTQSRWVILEDGKPYTWRNGYPAVFDSKQEALEEISNWATIKNVSIIDEDAFHLRFMNEEYVKGVEGYYDRLGIMDTTNGHNAELVAKINKVWDTMRFKLRPILVALYTRDINEIYESDAFSGERWNGWVDALDLLESLWEEYAGNYLQHIADDKDLQTILDFIRFDDRT